MVNNTYMYLQSYNDIEELEWAIEQAKKSNLPVAASMCIGEEGDMSDVSLEDCAVRMAEAGASVGNMLMFIITFMLNVA